jgi:hypothetical protein
VEETITGAVKRLLAGRVNEILLENPDGDLFCFGD